MRVTGYIDRDAVGRKALYWPELASGREPDFPSLHQTLLRMIAHPNRIACQRPIE